MTKREFLDRLERCLASLDAGERAGMVDFYSEQIDDRIDDGMTEAEAVASLESPEDIAANILALREDTATVQPSKAQAQDAAKKPQGCLHVAGKIALWTCAIIGIIILLPVALGLASALFATYIAFWSIVVMLGALALACVGTGVLNIVASIAEPVSATPALVANIAFSAGSFGLAVLLALGAYFLAKLLVMLVVWSVRAIRQRGDKTPPATSKAYPSMPMPPMNGATRKTKALPGWALLLIVGVIVVIVSGITALGAMFAAGGPEELGAQAYRSRAPQELTVKGFAVDIIDLSLDASNQSWKPAVSVGISPDDDIHVIGNDPASGGMLYWGDNTFVSGVQSGSELSLSARYTTHFTMQTALSALYGASGSNNRVRILIPQDWKGSIVCNDPTARITVSGYAQESLCIDGPITIARASDVYLTELEANTVTVTGSHAVIANLRTQELSVNEGALLGQGYLINVTADQLNLGGQKIKLLQVEAEHVETSSSTTVVQEDQTASTPQTS